MIKEWVCGMKNLFNKKNGFTRGVCDVSDNCDEIQIESTKTYFHYDSRKILECSQTITQSNDATNYS